MGDPARKPPCLYSLSCPPVSVCRYRGVIGSSDAS
jgi:hypothetical protein